MEKLKYFIIITTFFLVTNLLYAVQIDSTQNEIDIIPEKKLESLHKNQILTKEEIFRLPIRNYSEIVTTISDYTINEREFVPSYRRDKLEFLEFNLDGFSIKDYKGNSPLIINKNIIEKLQLITGENDISYSRLSNGGINLISTSTKPIYFGSFEYVTDNFLFNGFKNLRCTGTELTNFSIGGPLIPNNPNLIQFYGSFEYSFERNPHQSYYSEKLRNVSNNIWPIFQFNTINYIQSMAHRRVFTPEEVGSKEYNETAKLLMLDEPRWNKVKIGQIPDAAKIYYLWNEKITLNLDDLKFIISGFSTRMKNRMVIPSYTFMNSFNHPLQISNSDIFYIKSSWNVKPNLSFNAGISYSSIYFENSHPKHRKNYFDYGDYNQNPLFANYFHYIQPGLRVPFDPYIGEFALPGRIYDYLSFSKNQILQFKGDVIYKYNNHNFALGTEFNTQWIRKYMIYPLSLAQMNDTLKNIIIKNPDFLDHTQLQKVFDEFIARGIDSYGYDYFGREINYSKYNHSKRSEGPKKPIYGGLFIQDKIHFDLIKLNIGFRMDIWDPNDYKLKDISDLTNSKNTRLYGTPENFKMLHPDLPVPSDGWGNPSSIDDDSFVKTKPSVSINPRFGILFNLPKYTSILFLNYQTFTYLPDYDLIYMSSDRIRSIYKTRYFINNIKYSGVKPLYTTQFDIGLSKQTKNDVIINLTLYNRKTMRNLEPQYIQTDLGLATYILNSYQIETLGFELSANTPKWKNIQGVFNYSYAYKTHSKFKFPYYDDLDDSHSLLVNLFYDNFPFGINLILRAIKEKNILVKSPDILYSINPIKNDAWKQQLDLKLLYNFRIWKGINLVSYAEIKNLLNSKNLFYEKLTKYNVEDAIKLLVSQDRADEIPVLLGLNDMSKNDYTFAGFSRSLRIGLLMEF